LTPRREITFGPSVFFDKPLADLLDMQDEIVARLAGQMNAELVTAEARRAERAPLPDFDGPLFPGQGERE
jgi:hypothetical protein